MLPVRHQSATGAGCISSPVAAFHIAPSSSPACTRPPCPMRWLIPPPRHRSRGRQSVTNCLPHKHDYKASPSPAARVCCLCGCLITCPHKVTLASIARPEAQGLRTIKPLPLLVRPLPFLLLSPRPRRGGGPKFSHICASFLCGLWPRVAFDQLRPLQQPSALTALRWLQSRLGVSASPTSALCGKPPVLICI